MRKFFNEFFYPPKHEKISEKVMLTRMVSTVVVVLICLAAMSVSAYAYFSANIVSSSNVIKTANLEVNVSIVNADKNNEPIEINQVDRVTQTATLYKGNTYSVTIEKSGTARTGFCVITPSGCEIENYHTQQIGDDVKSQTSKNSITFTITVTDTTVVEFYAHLGTSSYYGYVGYPDDINERYILDGEAVEMVVTAPANTDAVSDEVSDGADDVAVEEVVSTPSETTESTENLETQSTTESEDLSENIDTTSTEAIAE